MRYWALLMTGVLAGTVCAVEQHSATGLLLKIDPAQHRILVSCQAIPGYMEAKVMPVSVGFSESFAGLSPGMLVDFTLVVTKTSSYAENIRRRSFDPGEGGQQALEAHRLQLLEELDGSSPPNTLAVGQPVPDFRLIDQNRRPVTLAQFAGKVVALNFIYTHCPLANYCFRLSNNFRILQQRFHQRLGQDLILLSISFDPVNDRPEVLADYAGNWKAEPDDWRFLTGPVSEVRRVCRMLGVDFWPDEAELMHSLHTAIVDRQGKLAANLEGNQFTAQQLGDLVETVMSGAK